MAIDRITGGRPLFGTVEVQGAKNSVLPILAATVLARGECVLRRCPDLSDVRASAAILRQLGAKVHREGDTLTVDASCLTGSEVSDQLMREMRSSVIFLGGILARQGEAVMSFPGGCELGPRPIDLHLKALRALGAYIQEEGGALVCSAPALTGCEITLALPSVGATENIMLAATAAKGTTLIVGAAREPEIIDLQNFLNAMGAQVRGAGSSVIAIEGGRPLHGVEYTVMPDRIVAATWMCAAAAAGGDVELCGVDYRQLSTVSAALTEAGCTVTSTAERVRIQSAGHLGGARMVRTAPYPGFPTDAQAPVMAALAKGCGVTVFVENMFEARYRHVDELVRMGADIRVEGRVAVVTGVPRLSGAKLMCTDLRGGAALLVAALSADGESILEGLHHLDRGYERPEETLRALGAQVERIEES
ncbi:MAG: UDP-N-acetylglucosamine 1-carboxyvinyltransferase [Oscillospiraceae bacterium]|nr:UDP-N-acetylglucosamine 1-carboxyvinyltransferase [Oscillospiraceae bacterium]